MSPAQNEPWLCQYVQLCKLTEYKIFYFVSLDYDLRVNKNIMIKVEHDKLNI